MSLMGTEERARYDSFYEPDLKVSIKRPTRSGARVERREFCVVGRFSPRIGWNRLSLLASSSG